MRKEYELTELKVKRRGILPALQEKSDAKVRVTLSLDADIIEYFKQIAQTGSLSYQQQINQALRELVDSASPAVSNR